MTHTRHIGALLALALTLVLGACSTPEDLTTPMLEPQFGSAEDDIGIDVATISTGRIYTLSNENGPYEGDYGMGGRYSKAILSRRDGSGNLTWSRDIESHYCSDDGDYGYYTCPDVKAISTATNSQGYVYALTTRWYLVDCCSSEVVYTVYRYSASGSPVSAFDLPYAADYPDSYAEFAVDDSGNVFVTYSYTPSHYSGDDYTPQNVVTKYSPTGTLQWQRTSTVGTPSDITVSSSGSVYVVGSAGLARYSSSGGLTWTKPGNFEEVIVSGSNLYTRYRKDIRKYDGNGNQLWLKSQSGLNTMVFQAMDGDGSGNVYLSGKYDADSSSNLSMNAMVRKLNSSGTVLFTKTYGTSAYDDALGIATITGSEIYTTGETQGSLAHTNIGGRDGYIRKFSSSGGTVWTR